MPRAETTFSNGLELANLGERIRARRRAQKLTLDELAERAGVSRSMLSDIERGAKVPTLLVFDRLAVALGSTVGRLLDAERPARVIVRRRTEHEIAHEPDGATRRILSPTLPGFALSITEITLPPGVATGEQPPDPPGSHRFLVVTEGTLRLALDGEPYTLATGDSAYYAGDCRHTYANPAAVPCRYYLAHYCPASPASGAA